MIVLDEQLLGRQLEHEIGTWYRGSVVFITDLRPNTIIKDDAIPVLLRQHPTPTFITINESDFWQRVVIDPHFCVICCALPDSRATGLPLLLRRLLGHPIFRSKTARMGRVIRLTTTTASYYTYRDPTVQTVLL
jgi:hypothetical protein